MNDGEELNSDETIMSMAQLEYGEDYEIEVEEAAHLDPEAVKRNAALHQKILRYVDAGAQSRKHLQGLAVQEKGTAEARKGKHVEGLKWHEGHLADRPWHEHPAFQENARQQRKFVEAEKKLGMYITGDDSDYIPRENGPDYLEVKATTRVSATSIKRRLSKAELEVSGQLLKLAAAISDAVARSDRAVAGKLLIQAKAIRGHGGFVEWVERETGLSARSAQRYILEAAAP
jgi:hypothetical protein